MAPRSAKRPEPVKRRASRASALQGGVVAVGGMISRNPVLVGGSTAFLVTLFYVSANALWYQPFPHTGAFFATRSIEGITHPTEPETTINIVRPSTAPAPIKGDPVVERVQGILKDLDFYSGTVDGISGPNTRKAIQAYQQKTGLNASGDIDALLLDQLGATPTSDWDIDGGHMAERSAAFIIIALGESVVVMGATLSEAVLDTGVVLAFLASFGASVAMWWLYFAVGAETGRHRIEAADDPGRVARITYTYLPVLLVAGIIVTAVADELTVAHPGGHDADLATVLTLIGGPALYVFGNLLFKKVTSGRVPLSHLVGLALLVVVGLVGLRAEPLSLSIATTVILFGIAYWEQRLGESRAAHRA